MKTITKYIADDGTEFNTKLECVCRDSLISEINKIMEGLPKRPTDTNFVNGAGFIQHKAAIFLEVRRKLLELIGKHIKHDWVQMAIDDPNDNPSNIGRVVDYNKPLCTAWNRIWCIDKYFKEWGQVYFAQNPNEGTQKQLN